LTVQALSNLEIVFSIISLDLMTNLPLLVISLDKKKHYRREKINCYNSN
jgi:hypothetical protein